MRYPTFGVAEELRRTQRRGAVLHCPPIVGSANERALISSTSAVAALDLLIFLAPRYDSISKYCSSIHQTQTSKLEADSISTRNSYIHRHNIYTPSRRSEINSDVNTSAGSAGPLLRPAPAAAGMDRAVGRGEREVLLRAAGDGAEPVGGADGGRAGRGRGRAPRISESEPGGPGEGGRRADGR